MCPSLFQLLLVIAAVFAVVVYRAAVFAVLVAQDTFNMGAVSVATSATAALVNLIIIMLLNKVTRPSRCAREGNILLIQWFRGVTNNSPSRDYSHPDDLTTQTT